MEPATRPAATCPAELRLVEYDETFRKTGKHDPADLRNICFHILIEQLDSLNDFKVAHAARALGTTCDQAAAAPLLKHMNRAQMRGSSVMVIGDPEPPPEDQPPWPWGWDIFNGLDDLQSPALADIAITLLKPASVRGKDEVFDAAWAVRVIAKFGRPQDEMVLRPYLQDPSDSVRLAAAQYFIRKGHDSMAPLLMGHLKNAPPSPQVTMAEVCQEYVRQALAYDGKTDIDEERFNGLGHMLRDRLSEQHIRRLFSHKSFYILRIGMDALVAQETPALITLLRTDLQQLLSCDDWYCRTRAACLLKKIDPATDLGKVLADHLLAEKKDQIVNIPMACEMLTLAGHAPARAMLHRVVTDKQHPIWDRAGAIIALGKCGNIESLELLYEQVRPAWRMTPELYRNITAWIEQLRSSRRSQQDEAAAKLVAAGSLAGPQLWEFVRCGDRKLRTRVRDVIQRAKIDTRVLDDSVGYYRADAMTSIIRLSDRGVCP